MLLLLPGASGALGTGWAGIWGGQMPQPTPLSLATFLTQKQACLQRICFFSLQWECVCANPCQMYAHLQIAHLCM